MTRTLLLYVRENNGGRLGGLLDGLALDERYLLDANNWVSHAFLQQLYHRMIDILGDDREVEEIQCQVPPEAYGKRSWPDHPHQGSNGCLYRVRREPRRPLLKRFFTKRNTYDQAIEELQHANQLIQAKYDEVKQLVSDLETVNRELTKSQRDLDSQRKELAESERLYRLLAENASDIIWVLNLSTLEFEYMSPSVERIRGFTLEEAMALRLEETLSPSSYRTAIQILEEELANETRKDIDPQRSRRVELELSLKNGDYVWCEVIVSFVRNRQGEPVAVMGATRDITERKKAEAVIAESEAKYRDLFENGSEYPQSYSRSI